MFVSTNLLGQTDAGLYPEISFGVTHSAYTSMCFQSGRNLQNVHSENTTPQHQSTITETNTGFGIGFFLYLPLNDGLVFRPKLEGLFSTNSISKPPTIYSTSLDLKFSPGFCIALKPADEHGIVYIARNMSCYLTYKQPYISVGPIISVQKFDDGFLNKGFSNELCFGASIGYGINYEFHGTNIAPEISYQITSTAQNKISDKNKMYHSISLSINLF